MENNLSKNQENIVKKEIKQIDRLVKKERRILRRIPLFFPLLASFGLVSTFYGFEKFIDATIFADQPLVMILIGILLLIATGSVANKL